jgi:pyridoxamine 5'-phosphate oxidase-like protein
MTATLPDAVQQVFDRFITTEYTTVDGRGQPITWPVTPYYRPGDRCIDVTTGVGYPKKADDARANPKVALLFSDPTGSGLEGTPQVLVQGTAEVDERDLAANRERYARESGEKLPAVKSMLPPKFMRKPFDWYFARIYVHVQPERVYVWEGGDATREPQLFDSHMEEVRSGHDEEPETDPAPVAGGAEVWDERMDELGSRYPAAVLSIVSPDGFPFSVRVPIAVDRASRRVRIAAAPVGVPLQPGLACLTAHDHHPDFRWQRNFQVRGDLVEEDGDWALVPHKLVGGFEVPPGSFITQLRANAGKARRFRKIAKQRARA